MQRFVITFIGAGNMAQSLIGGLIANGFPGQYIWASDPSLEKLKQLQEKYGIAIEQSNSKAALQADVLLLAVKPQKIQYIATELYPIIEQRKPLIISIAAGIPIHSLERWLNRASSIVRCMPNTPALVQTGVTGLYANPSVTSNQKFLAESILKAVGICLWFDHEEQLDIVTALSGSGPAYFLFFMEALEESAVALGLSAPVAHLLTVQTALGTARLASVSGEANLNLRQKVTSPGGTTEQAIHTLQTREFKEIVNKAVQAAYQRSKTLTIELGKDHA